MFHAGDRGEKLQDFSRTEDHRQGLWLLGHREDVLDPPVLVEGDRVEEAERRDRDDHGTRGKLTLRGEIDLIRADLAPELLW